MGLLALVMAGCEEETVDVYPPAVPNGVSTITGDGEIWVIWNANREYDLAGYRVYSTTQVDQDFQPINWEILLEIGTPFPDFSEVFYEPDGSGGRPYLVFIDRSVTNGSDYYYAITAFDDFGNESELSTDLAVDTPRPEGSVTLVSAGLNLAASGFDFSDKSVRSGDDPLADLIFEVRDGLATLQAQTPWVRIQDYGNVDFDIASWAPEFGWSAIDLVEAIPGHSYFLEIVDGDELNYAKVSVLSVDSSQISLKWGYQPVVGLPELKRPVEDLPPRIARKEG
jgi:hypothetical protein